MTLALYIFLALVLVGAVLKLTDRSSSEPEAAPTATTEPEECCGQHAVCERLAPTDDEHEYYDDEDLDAYRGRSADSYSPQEEDQFRDVLLTLLPSDIAPWARAIERRGITLPDAVRDELVMLLSET